ncbi:AI-2E family transporter [Dasania sp. GY-MA-18]|uniref:AI-2E family transporter n=1 Tax=Dasania phycosphaerae TaxID=2950436 RepID=A0A9J6RPV6_9GAMM|nr:MULTISPECIES: AI-2E family transporter [Dasania]MCR8923903.1 AI-2E family transporter [Dasania sp. GY-MA-18]MCZ0866337.1 AI-2E family transporter [Dasania phycosphaerae]MCZ0870061.1 AI-2E family transporter [Dasania phycosphaerae]
MVAVLKKWLDHLFANEEALILLMLIFGSLLLVISMGDVLAPVIASIIFAFLMQGTIAQLTRRNVPSWCAITLAYTLFVGMFMAVMFLLLPLAWRQLATLFQELPAMIAKGQQLLLVLPERYPEFVTHGQIRDWVSLTKSELGNIGQWLLSFSFSNLANVMGLLIYIVLVPIMVFFFLRDKDALLAWLSSFLPAHRPMLNKVWVEMNDQVANYVRGKAIEIFIVGGVSYIAFALIGLNYAALMALLVGVSVLIPYIGAAVVTIPVAMVGYFQWGGGSEFMTLIIIYAVIQALDGNVLVPLLFSEAVNLHPIAIIMAVLIFGGLWGLWGVFFAIPLATLIKAVLNAWPSKQSAAV